MKKIKLVGDLVNKSRDIEGNMLITFKVNNVRLEAMLLELENKPYSIEIKEVSNKRSLQQNAYLWALIDEIDKELNGYLSDRMGVYCQILEMANAKYEYLLCEERVLDSLRENAGIRALEVKGNEYVNGIEYLLVKVYIGSSKFDTKEMTQLLDTAIHYAEELGIVTDYYMEMLGAWNVKRERMEQILEIVDLTDWKTYREMRKYGIKMNSGNFQKLVRAYNELFYQRADKTFIAQVTHEANKEAINVYKLKLRILQDQFSKEYVNG